MKIINKFKKIIILFKNYKYIFLLKSFGYIDLFIKDVLINKKNIFPIGNGAIGHFPLSLFFSKYFFGNNSIYFYKSGVSNSNRFLDQKVKECFKFDQRYQYVYEIMKLIKFLTFGIFNFRKMPEHQFMGKKLNFSQAFDGKTKLFEFYNEENKKGELFLSKNNINKEKFICFIVRTSEYNKIYGSPEQSRRESTIMKFRNIDNPNAYIPSLEYLVNSGYSIIRMGKGFSNSFPYTHPKFFDYAISDERSDFLDIWLPANCKFFFGTLNGPIILPTMFNKPFLGTNSFPFGSILSYLPKSVHLPRLVKKNGKLLNFKEQVQLDVIRQINGIYYDKIGIQILENEPDDILNAVKDIENKIINGFLVNDLNIKFWKNMKREWDSELFLKNRIRKKTLFEEFHKLNGIKTSIPDFFLKKYKDVFYY